jgi:hypothetical protein
MGHASAEASLESLAVPPLLLPQPDATAKRRMAWRNPNAESEERFIVLR